MAGDSLGPSTAGGTVTTGRNGKRFSKAMHTNTSQHILNASANLLGFCLFVITSLSIANRTEAHYIDEFTSIVAVLLTFSCICSFISIRTRRQILSRRCETIADYLFIVSLVGLLLVILFITFTFMT